MRPYWWLAVSAFALLMSGPLCARTIDDANKAGASGGGASPGFHSDSVDNPPPNAPMPTDAPLPINDPSKGSSQGDPGNRIPLLIPPGTAESSGTVGGDYPGTSGSR